MFNLLCVCVLSPSVCVSCLQIFSIVVFATITAEGYINKHTTEETKCMFNENDSACNYGVGIGVIAFLACAVMLILDANFPQISNAQQRKIIVMGDFVFSGESRIFYILFRPEELHPKTGSKVLRESSGFLFTYVFVLIFSSPDSCVDASVVHLFLCPGQPVGKYVDSVPWIT